MGRGLSTPLVNTATRRNAGDAEKEMRSIENTKRESAALRDAARHLQRRKKKRRARVGTADTDALPGTAAGALSGALLSNETASRCR